MMFQTSSYHTRSFKIKRQGGKLLNYTLLLSFFAQGVAALFRILDTRKFCAKTNGYFFLSQTKRNFLPRLGKK